MNRLGDKIAYKRKELGMTQTQFAEKLSVTRQTVSRWEAGTVMPDIDKIGDIAGILNVSCDYLLKDSVEDPGDQADMSAGSPVSRLLMNAKGKLVKLAFFDGEADPDLFNTACRIIDFEGNWMKILAHTRKGDMEKLISVSSVLSIEIMEEDE